MWKRSTFPLFHMCDYTSILAYIIDRGSIFVSSHIYKYFLLFWSGWLCLGGHFNYLFHKSSVVGLCWVQGLRISQYNELSSLQTYSGLENSSKYKMMKKIRVQFSEHKAKFSQNKLFLTKNKIFWKSKFPQEYNVLGESLLTKWRIAAKILYTVWISSGLNPITFMASATTLNSAASLMED